jgi:hypothetical protein
MNLDYCETIILPNVYLIVDWSQFRAAQLPF